MTKVRVLAPFVSGDKAFNIGQTVELEDGFALKLVASGLVEEEKKTVAPAAAPAKKKAVKKNEGK